ncbi:coagulation factor X-like [Chironomus tepperi]|uniref:coagulation factor X-like n=1 Tax=Chironomus tepperi TaxID=113505 RepID=UPI00391F17C4
MNSAILTILLLYITTIPTSVIAGTSYCSFEHTSRYQSDLITDEITGYMCKLDLDVKGDRVNDVGGGHLEGERDTLVDIIKVRPEFYSYLTTFPSTFCSRFKNLEIIDMCRAEISKIEEDALDNCKDLRIIQFYMNKFEQVPANLFAETKKLLKIFITFNSNLKSLPEGLFTDLVELKLLDLSYNMINHLPSGIFDGLDNLKELNLEGNSLTDIEIGLFDKLEFLEVLNMNGNGLLELTSTIFSGLTGLKTLLLKSNQLSVIHADSFPNQTNFDTVDLTRNKIDAIEELFVDNCGISTLKMSGNVCDKTSLIKKKDMKKKLTRCFRNYIEQNGGDHPITPKPTRPPTKATTQRGLRPRPTTTQSTTTTTTMKPPTPTKSNTKKQKLEPLYQPCGVAKVAGQHAAEGTEVANPWIAAIVHKTEGYFCGGTLYTKRLVVTAAHCIRSKHQPEKKASDLSVHLGVHKLDNPNETGRKSYAVLSIDIHNQFNPQEEDLDADIAVLKLSVDVAFSDWIQPVCIAKIMAPLKNFHDGVVVGFGRTEKSGRHSNVPTKVSIPIRDRGDCYNEFPSLKNIASHRTFCGGYADGTGACTGDNGGGLTVVQDNVHYLRGIVSASIHGTDYGCDVQSYAIYTDVKNFITYLKGIQ